MRIGRRASFSEMKKYLTLLAALFAALMFFGCQKDEEAKNRDFQTPAIEPARTIAPKNVDEVKIDVPRLAGKPAEEFDRIFGKPEQVTPATAAKEIPGEYRLYKIEGNPKGLSVRFYKNKAVRFNLILEKPFASANDALHQAFNIDVKNIPPTIEKNEPLSYKWRGDFGGVRFATVYAKKDKPDGQFVMVHAETTQ